MHVKASVHTVCIACVQEMNDPSAQRPISVKTTSPVTQLAFSHGIRLQLTIRSELWIGLQSGSNMIIRSGNSFRLDFVFTEWCSDGLQAVYSGLIMFIVVP